MAEERRWLCPTRQHVLGLVVTENGRGSGVLLFREAVPVDGDITEAHQIGLAFGELTVYCSCCGQVRTWIPGEDELKFLILKHRAKKEADLQPDSFRDRMAPIK